MAIILLLRLHFLTPLLLLLMLLLLLLPSSDIYFIIAIYINQALCFLKSLPAHNNK